MQSFVYIYYLKFNSALHKRMRPLSSSPQQEQHMDDVFLCHLCRELWRGVHKCARVSVSVVHGVHSVQNVLSPDGGFQRVFCEVCAHLQNVSDSVAELDAPRNPFDDSDELCARQEKQLRKGFQPGEQKRTLAPDPGAFPSGGKSGDFSGGRPGPSGGGFGDLAKSGAPAAILINAYSGDFCHPVLSNALAQEPLVYHSGTRELFSDIFGNTSKTDGTEFDISSFFVFFRNLTIFAQN